MDRLLAANRRPYQLDSLIGLQAPPPEDIQHHRLMFVFALKSWWISDIAATAYLLVTVAQSTVDFPFRLVALIGCWRLHYSAYSQQTHFHWLNRLTPPGYSLIARGALPQSVVEQLNGA
jgi:hypothetical protein